MSDFKPATFDLLLTRAAHALEHHPKKVTVAIAALLLGGAGAAFGVASLDPDPAAFPTRDIVEPVATLPVQQQLEQLEAFGFRLYRSETARPDDTVASLLARLGIDDSQAADWLRRSPEFRANVLAHYGRNVTAEAGEKQELLKLTVRWASDDSGTFQRLVIERDAAGRFASRVESAPLVAGTRMGSATVKTSLFAAADEANIPDPVVSQMVEIFGSELDFHRQLRDGDHFEVVYETLEADGEPLRTGRILSAEFVNRGTTHRAVWFQEAASRKGGYFDFEGHSLAKSFLASPVAFSRVSSGFAMRLHPVFNQWKAHLGTDYAAVTGTPVRSVAEGTVEFSGQQNGFGNVVIVRHNAQDETLYAHLSRLGVRGGEHVAQGEVVGNVGQTGWATGPHLHFEFRVNGVHQDPAIAMARRAASGAVLADASRPAFDRVLRSMRAQLEAAAQASAVASAE